MKRAGPTFLAWMLGRIAHPLLRARCDACGRPTDGTGEVRLLPVLLLCDRCRRARLLLSVRG